MGYRLTSCGLCVIVILLHKIVWFQLHVQTMQDSHVRAIMSVWIFLFLQAHWWFHKLLSKWSLCWWLWWVRSVSGQAWTATRTGRVDSCLLSQLFSLFPLFSLLNLFLVFIILLDHSTISMGILLLLWQQAFSSGLYPYWRNESGAPRTPRDRFNRPTNAQG